MLDPLNKTDRYRTVAAQFANLAKSASSDFPRAYYQRIAERYQSLAEGHLDLQYDETAPSQSAAACALPNAMEPQLADVNGRGFVRIMRKVARRVGLRPLERTN